MDGKLTDCRAVLSTCHGVLPYMCNRRVTRAAQVSFYPQLYLNYSRQNVVGAYTAVCFVRLAMRAIARLDNIVLSAAGLSFDFVLYNEISFICYAAFSCALLFSPGVRQSYRDRHYGRDPGVRYDRRRFQSL